MKSKKQADYVIIGAGIIGLAIARELKIRFPAKSIIIIEKEPALAAHGSGRNSGVLHAGFYYTADSLKARFCRDGCAEWKDYVKARGLKLNHCKKVVVAKNEEERQGIHELKKRGDANGVEVHIVDEAELTKIDPNAKTYKEALYSPTTATIDPVEICLHLAGELRAEGVEILLAHPYRQKLGPLSILAGDTEITAGKIFNCAGLYADRIARDFGFCKDYTIIPFKGIHVLAARPPVPSVRTLIYPVPNLKNPFLGVHFNITVDGKIKIGPTAIPAFWRENYRGLSRFKLDELFAIAAWELKLFATNAFGFRRLAFEEIRKYSRRHLLNLVRPMVKELDDAAFTNWARPGIRAQLLHKKSLKLLQDFVVEGDDKTVHVLNAVSPAFTCSLPFGRYVVEKYTGSSK
ncbi:MAG: L-2-hydroxyglutarate oxidase [Alphaproteobacteria bacterium]|nr:L-2-hydroxyglutarate oxidase [Alphaproteobacteria bacterium]